MRQRTCTASRACGRARARSTSRAAPEIGIGARGWIDRLPLALGQRVAVFDTRAHKPRLLVGSAAQGMARRIRNRGYRLAADPESFFVSGTPGPLEEGELDRAEEWGRTLANEVVGSVVMI